MQRLEDRYGFKVHIAEEVDDPLENFGEGGIQVTYKLLETRERIAKSCLDERSRHAKQ